MPSKPRTLAGILRSRRHADREYNRTRRDPVVARIHGSARWQALRARVLRDEPLCRECARRGLTQPATQVDHVVLLARTPPVSAAPEASRKGPREGAPQVPGDRSGPPAHPARALGGEVDPRHRRVSVVQTQPRVDVGRELGVRVPHEALGLYEGDPGTGEERGVGEPCGHARRRRRRGGRLPGSKARGRRCPRGPDAQASRRGAGGPRASRTSPRGGERTRGAGAEDGARAFAPGSADALALRSAAGFALLGFLEAVGLALDHEHLRPVHEPVHERHHAAGVTDRPMKATASSAKLGHLAEV